MNGNRSELFLKFLFRFGMDLHSKYSGDCHCAVSLMFEGLTQDRARAARQQVVGERLPERFGIGQCAVCLRV